MLSDKEYVCSVYSLSSKKIGIIFQRFVQLKRTRAKHREIDTFELLISRKLYLVRSRRYKLMHVENSERHGVWLARKLVTGRAF